MNVSSPTLLLVPRMRRPLVGNVAPVAENSILTRARDIPARCQLTCSRSTITSRAVVWGHPLCPHGSRAFVGRTLDRGRKG